MTDEIEDWAMKIAERFGDEWSDGCCDHPYEVDFDALAAALRKARNKALDEAAAEFTGGYHSHQDIKKAILALKSPTKEPKP